MRITPTEAETQKAVLEFLAAHSIYAGRLNTGAGFVNGRPILHHTFGKGCADILAFPVICEECVQQDGNHGHILPLWVEVKAPGKKQRPEQVSFQQHVESLGHTYLVVDSVDQIIQWVKELHL